MIEYDVLPIPTTIGDIIDRNNQRLRPFVAVYFPKEILDEMKWARKTRLALSIEKDYLKIYQTDTEIEHFYTNELRYEPIEDDF